MYKIFFDFALRHLLHKLSHGRFCCQIYPVEIGVKIPPSHVLGYIITLILLARVTLPLAALFPHASQSYIPLFNRLPILIIDTLGHQEARLPMVMPHY